MDSVTFTFGGLQKLAADLVKAGPEVARDVEDELDEAGRKVVARAKQLAPVDTGATQRSIGIQRTGTMARTIGPTTPYARYLELGTSKMSPKPFMGPASDVSTGDLPGEIAGHGARAITRGGGS